jgi:hypothetical protein
MASDLLSSSNVDGLKLTDRWNLVYTRRNSAHPIVFLNVTTSNLVATIARPCDITCKHVKTTLGVCDARESIQHLC